MQHSYNDIGSAIRKQRHRAGLTQEKLAEYSGLSVNFISKIERTEGQNISFQKLGNIADAEGLILLISSLKKILVAKMKCHHIPQCYFGN